ncbi:MAG: CocE/NonD family hydrolase [Planctomycetes bacterium]|nr:CocE/NonD family hydrolase [Planctomycetota bacterium]
MTTPSIALDDIEHVEHIWIPLSDGCRLAARMWLPRLAARERVPAILESIPYRKRDVTRARDERMHGFFARKGYACVRVDVRGCGESDGRLDDEYTEREQLDTMEVIAWLAAQRWCNGKVGMIGKSWGGFAALQVAARRPPALAAVISVCSTDDRYADDAHYMGGCLLNENLIWGSVLMTSNALPPDPELVGDAWRSIWRERLERMPLFVAKWLEHQRRDDYWRQGSVCEDFAAIRCPVYAVGGWADGYSNAIPRLMAGLNCPRKALIGPWAHVYPHEGIPRPAIDFLAEATRWWNHWLKGIDDGIMTEPRFRVWMQSAVTPRSFYDVRPGRWVAEEAWPLVSTDSPRCTTRRLVLNWRRLEERASPPAPLASRSPQTVGLTAGSWCGFGVEGEMPTDQRADDGKSLAFDSEPILEPFEILGAPELELRLSVDRPLALIAIRLNDVAPDGAVTRVTYCVRNLCRGDDGSASVELPVGRPFSVRLRLGDVAHRFEAGHRLRVSISSTYWPIVWPAPHPVRLTLMTGESTLLLPVRTPSTVDDALKPFAAPEDDPPSEPQSTHGEPDTDVERTVTWDVATDETVYRSTTDAAEDGEPILETIPDIGIESGHSIVERFTIRDDDPLSASGQVDHVVVRRRGEWQIRIETRTSMSADALRFHVAAELRAHEGETCVFERRWERSILRDGV